MALTSKSLFLYNYEITPLNASLDFRAVMGGPVLQATLRLGFYSLSSLLREVVRSLQAIDQANTYSAVANRSYLGGLENRVTISMNGTYFDLLFQSGPRAASSVGFILGFDAIDQTGAISYMGTHTSGVIMIPTFVGYRYLGPTFQQKVFGAVNVSASGVKEAVVFDFQQFIEIQFKYEPEAKIISEWIPFSNWAISQKLFDFTPQISNPNVFYEVTLDKTGSDGKGMMMKYSEQLPDFPNLYDVGLLTMRINEV